MLLKILENGLPMALMQFVSDDNLPLGWEESFTVPMADGRGALIFIHTCTPDLYIKDLAVPDPDNERDPDSALNWAIQMGDARLVQRLLWGGADHEVEDHTSWKRPILMAARKGNVDMVRSLLEKELSTHWQTMALEAAVVSGHENVTRLLLDNGVDVNCRKYGKARYTLLSNLVKTHCQSTIPTPWTEDSESMMRLLLGYGADPTIPDGDRKSAMYHAEEHNHQDILNVLSEPYPWRGVEPRSRGELRIAGTEPRKERRQFWGQWIIRRLLRRSRSAARAGNNNIRAVFSKKEAMRMPISKGF